MTFDTSDTFDKFGLSEKLLRAIAEQGYTKPTPIQVEAIPRILEGGDFMAAAQTGTGKSAGFLLPILEKLTKSRKKPIPRALVITPTRELAAQVDNNIRAYGKYLDIKSAVLFGGISSKPQIMRLRSGVDIVVATPGRLLDLVNMQKVNLSEVEIVVLDEADRMLDMGFIDDIKKIFSLLPKERQGLLFSATFSDEIKRLAAIFLRQPQVIQVNAENSVAESVAQVVHPVDHEKKRELLSFLIQSKEEAQILVFTRTKQTADSLSYDLQQEGIQAVAIHGDKSQIVRAKTLDRFKRKQIQVLVATDVASRGLDINNLSFVVNFDMPFATEDYVHRIGRTGRAGKQGEAVSLVAHDEFRMLQRIEKLLKQKIPQVIVEGYEPKRAFDPDRGGNDRGGFFKKRRSGGSSSGGGFGRFSSRSYDDKPRGGFRSREGREFREPREFNREPREPREFNREPREPREPREFNREPREGREFSREPREFNRQPRENRDRDDSRGFDRRAKRPGGYSEGFRKKEFEAV